MKLFSIKDKTTGYFAKPFSEPTTQAAIRAARMEVNRAHEGNLLYHYPGEYELYELGEMNEATGVISTNANLPVGDGQPTLVANLETYKDKANA